jgi:hypothetical protein
LADGLSDPDPVALADEAPPSSTRRLRTVVAVIGPALLVSLILGYFLVKADQEGDANRRTIADQQATIDRLRAESGMWQVLAANPANPAAQPAPSPTAPAVRQLRSGSLVLPFLYCVDLDTPAAENWRMTNADCGRGADLLLGQDFQGIRTTLGGLHRMFGEKVSFEDCARLGPSDQPIPYSQIFLETKICARTSEDNVALLEVVAAVMQSGHPDQITFNVTVWAR